MISMWMDRGSASDFVKEHEEFDVFPLVSFQSWSRPKPKFHQIQGVARGLDYLHEMNVVHSDIKAVSARYSCPY